LPGGYAERGDKKNKIRGKKYFFILFERRNRPAPKKKTPQDYGAIL